ncbi:unnamed protein product [Effrenium voratum]|nr:unnamed protein product [Effrenium voratum]
MYHVFWVFATYKSIFWPEDGQEMAREALGDTVHLRQALADEKAERARDRLQLDTISREINTMQALLREATAGSSLKANQPSPRPEQRFAT